MLKNKEIRRKWLGLCISGVLIATALLYMLAGWLPHGEKEPGNAVSEHTAVLSPKMIPRSTYHRQESDILPILENKGSSPEPSPTGRIHPVMQSALRNNPDMAEYQWLAQKVLPTKEQRRLRRKMLSDPELIQIAWTGLLAPTETTFTKEGEAERMLYVEFLADAVAWADNPEVETVAFAIEDVLFAENISHETPDDLAQSLAGDKMELFTQMLHYAPDRAITIYERAQQGREVMALLTYTRTWYESEIRAMRANELP